MTAAKIMDIISTLPGCAGQAADAVSAYTQVKKEHVPKLLKIPKSECPDIWIRLPQHKWPKSWSSMEDPVVLLERKVVRTPTCWPLVGKTILRKFFGTRMGKKYRTGNASLCFANEDYSCRSTWMTSKWLEESRLRVPCGRN